MRMSSVGAIAFKLFDFEFVHFFTKKTLKIFQNHSWALFWMQIKGLVLTVQRKHSLTILNIYFFTCNLLSPNCFYLIHVMKKQWISLKMHRNVYVRQFLFRSKSYMKLKFTKKSFQTSFYITNIVEANVRKLYFTLMLQTFRMCFDCNPC